MDVVDLLAGLAAANTDPVPFNHQGPDIQWYPAGIGVVAAGQHVSEADANGVANVRIGRELPVS